MSKRLTRSISTPKGFRTAGVTCGIKRSGKPDMTLIVADRLCTAAGVFTRNRIRGAGVMVSKRHLGSGHAQAIVANSGNSNSATGKVGIQHAVRTTRCVAKELMNQGLNLDYRNVLPNSTGEIGVQLPMEKIERGVPMLISRLDRGPAADARAARGIMTTDLVPKAAYRQIRIASTLVHLGGIAKGSGMISPQMATMLAFVTTDAVIEPQALQIALRSAAMVSFNRISVDQHTSPCDTLLMLASGAAAHKPIRRITGHDYDRFAEALTDLCRDLANQIVRDGEGATKVFHVRVSGARSEREANQVAKAIVDSPLVKTAVHGGDPEWGRILTAAGYGGAPIQPDRLSLSIGAGSRGGIRVFESGTPVPLTATSVRRLRRFMASRDMTFALDLGRGKATVEWLGCDLTREYVSINVE